MNETGGASMDGAGAGLMSGSGQADNELAEYASQLRERMKELRCLHAVSDILAQADAPLERLLQDVVRVLPSGFQFPRNEGVRAVVEGREYRSARFPDSPNVIRAEIADGGAVKGMIEVALDREVAGQPGVVPFLKEEADLLTMVARRVGATLALRQAEEERRAALEAKAGFVSMVSHELRTPLTAIKEGIDIVLDGTAGPLQPEQIEFLELARRNVHRLARLVNDVLSFQKLELGRAHFQFKEERLDEVLAEVVATMAPAARAKGLSLGLEGCERPLALLFDRDKVVQVATNLISNAVKFTERGAVAVRAGLEEGFAAVSVADTGPGIAPEDMPRLFQSFEQFGKAKDSRGSTGLGLAISRQIVLQHGGRIWADSTPGEGTAFHFTLPLAGEG